MKQNIIIVNHIDWDIVCKCKSGKYASKDECLKSIWTEEYANPIEDYNPHMMVGIMGQIIQEVVPIERRAYLLDTILQNGITTTEALLYKLYLYIMLLDVRKKNWLGKHEDLYIIECKGKYYTIDQYDELKESETNGKDNPV